MGGGSRVLGDAVFDLLPPEAGRSRAWQVVRRVGGRRGQLSHQRGWMCGCEGCHLTGGGGNAFAPKDTGGERGGGVGEGVTDRPTDQPTDRPQQGVAEAVTANASCTSCPPEKRARSSRQGSRQAGTQRAGCAEGRQTAARQAATDVRLRLQRIAPQRSRQPGAGGWRGGSRGEGVRGGCVGARATF